MRLVRVVLVFLSLCFLLHANDTKDNKAMIGLYLNQASKIDLKDGSFNVDFYIWYLWKNNQLKPDKSLELMNGTILSSVVVDERKIDDFFYVCKHIKATIKQSFNVRNFPLDSHDLKIIFEDSNDIANGVVCVVDTNNTKLDSDVVVPGYIIDSYKLHDMIKKYSTNYGDFKTPKENVYDYSRIIFDIQVQRDGYKIFFKTFWGYFIAMLVALAAFGIDPKNTSRFSLTIASIFAASTNGIILRGALPEVSYWVLVDKVGALTLGLIFVIIVISSVSLRFSLAQNEKIRLKIDHYSLIVIATIYLVSLIIFVSDT